MKAAINILIASLISVMSYAQGIEIKDHCPLENNKESVKDALIPYKIEYSKDYKISLKEYNQMKDFMIDLVYDSPYRLVFNTTGMPQPIKVVITGKEPDHKKAQVLFEKSGNGQFVYDIPGIEASERPRKVYVTIFVEASQGLDPNVRERGCVNFIYGTLPLHGAF